MSERDGELRTEDNVVIPRHVYRMVLATITRLNDLLDKRPYPHMQCHEYLIEHMNIKDTLRMMPPNGKSDGAT